MTDVQKRRTHRFHAEATSTYASLVARGNKTKEILLRRQDANLDSILADILKEELKQKLACVHYEVRYHHNTASTDSCSVPACSVNTCD